jgi:hypothetical protein
MSKLHRSSAAALLVSAALAQLANVTSAFATSLQQANTVTPQSGATPAPLDPALAAQRMTMSCPDSAVTAAACSSCPPGYRGAGKNCVVDLRALSVLPLGWPDYALANRLAQHTAQAVVPAVLLKLLGWTFTIVALALGAPFWFDLLGTIVNVRNAGSVPPRSAQPAESSRLS